MIYKRGIEKLNKSEIKKVASEVSVRLFSDRLNNLTSFLFAKLLLHPPVVLKRSATEVVSRISWRLQVVR